MAKTQAALRGAIEPSSVFLLSHMYLDGWQLRHDVLQRVAPQSHGEGFRAFRDLRGSRTKAALKSSLEQRLKGFQAQLVRLRGAALVLQRKSHQYKCAQQS
jgi:hypothetical protein